MRAVKKYDRIVLKYLKKTRRFKTLKELEKCLDRKQKKDERKPVKLSFVIQKAPEREKAQVSSIFPKKQQPKIKKEPEEKKAVVIPDKFTKIAKKFGLPEDHLEFFYENRDSFNWESKDKTDIHCIDVGCKHTVKVSPGCLVDHMITVHNHRDIPCGKTDCSYVAYSDKNLTAHMKQFHGIGKKRVDGDHSCPFPTCKVSFVSPSKLQIHLNVHLNRLSTCHYCPYRTANRFDLHSHLDRHFQIKKFKCDICSSKFFTSKALMRHQKILHSNDEYICVDCKFTTPKFRRYELHRTSCKERLKHSRNL